MRTPLNSRTNGSRFKRRSRGTAGCKSGAGRPKRFSAFLRHEKISCPEDSMPRSLRGKEDRLTLIPDEMVDDDHPIFAAGRLRIPLPAWSGGQSLGNKIGQGSRIRIDFVGQVHGCRRLFDSGPSGVDSHFNKGEVSSNKLLNFRDL